MKKSGGAFRLPALALPAAFAFAPALIMGGVGKHHAQGLVIHFPHDVVTAPAGGGGYLPDNTEGAMAPDILGG
ncbi:MULTISPECIES: hypothetical protein [Bacteroidales]|uniref:hypothetical protein n=1 Tax=Bacteroidales TaxID=171549 RepID=UPI00258EFFF9|nr:MULTISPECIES: hypothetical protein [Bacteroidales]